MSSTSPAAAGEEGLPGPQVALEAKRDVVGDQQEIARRDVDAARRWAKAHTSGAAPEHDGLPGFAWVVPAEPGVASEVPVGAHEHEAPFDREGRQVRVRRVVRRGASGDQQLAQ